MSASVVAEVPEAEWRIIGPDEVPTTFNVSETLRWEVFEDDNYECQRCGSRRRLTVDHIVPRSKGGRAERGNLQTLCRTCNCQKGDR